LERGSRVTGAPSPDPAFGDRVPASSLVFAKTTGSLLVQPETSDPAPTDANGRTWTLPDLEGRKIATSYPRLVRAHLARNRVRADIIKLDGAVEISVQLVCV